MVIIDKIVEVRELIKDAVIKQRTISYGEVYRIFSEREKENQNDVWDTFEAAARTLADPSEYIFGALLAKKSDGLPANGFYDQYKNVKYQEYAKLTNEQSSKIQELTEHLKKSIAEQERKKIWSDYEKGILTLKVKSFRGYDNTINIVLEAQKRGITLVHGGRIEVRNKIDKVVKELIKLTNEEYSLTSINHPETELGVVFNTNIFDISQAEKIAIEEFEPNND